MPLGRYGVRAGCERRKTTVRSVSTGREQCKIHPRGRHVIRLALSGVAPTVTGVSTHV